MAHRTSLLSRQPDIVASFSFCTWSVRTCFLQRDVFTSFPQIYHSLNFYLNLHISAIFLITMSSTGRKRGTCCHVMTLFDDHLMCARCRDKGVGDDPCRFKKVCPICRAFTPEQIQQLSTPTYRTRKEKEQKGVSAP